LITARRDVSLSIMVSSQVVVPFAAGMERRESGAQSDIYRSRIPLRSMRATIAINARG
jgi:hypothetical protein